MDENFIKNIFQTVLAESVQVKVIRDRNSGYVLPDSHRTLFAPSLGTPSGNFADCLDFFLFFSCHWRPLGSREILLVCEKFSFLASSPPACQRFSWIARGFVYLAGVA